MAPERSSERSGRTSEGGASVNRSVEANTAGARVEVAAGGDAATALSRVPGVTGVTGKQGATGPSGASGAKGVTGATGKQGATGPKGATGACGATGPKGATGPAGSSFVLKVRDGDGTVIGTYVTGDEYIVVLGSDGGALPSFVLPARWHVGHQNRLRAASSCLRTVSPQT